MPPRAAKRRRIDDSSTKTCAKEQGDDDGMFLLLNGVLCRTADGTGAFRPADIFDHFDESFSVRTFQTLSELDNTHSKRVDGASANPSDPFANFAHNAPGNGGKDGKTPTDDTPPLSDAVFNVLGVISGGALIDPATDSFVDFADTEVFVPAPLGHSIASRAASGDTVRKQNAAAYERGAFNDIQPVAFLSLLSAVEPIAEAIEGNLRDVDTGDDWFGGDGATDDYPSWPQSAKLLSLRTMYDLTERHVRHRATLCGIPMNGKSLRSLPAKSAKASKAEAVLSRWRNVESLRWWVKQVWPAQRYLPYALRFRMQYNGQVLTEASSKEAARRESVIATVVEERKDHEDDDCLSRAPASVFPCYGGQPYMEVRRFCPRLMRLAFSNFAEDHDLFQRVRPQPHNPRAALAPASLVLLEGSRVYLLPPDPAHHSGRRRAWWVFKMYFEFLGIEARETAPGVTRYALRDDKPFSAARCVEEKCATEEAAAHASVSERESQKWRASKRVVSAAYDDLLLHQQDALMERLGRVEAYLHKLNKHRVERLVAQNEEETVEAGPTTS